MIERLAGLWRGEPLSPPIACRAMANQWPDGGEQPLTTGEKLVMGWVAVVLIAAIVGGALLFALSLFGPRPSIAMTAAVVVVSLALGILWVRPWETEGPRSQRRRR